MFNKSGTNKSGRLFAQWWRVCVVIIISSISLSSVLANGSWLGNAPDEAWIHPTDRALNNLGPAYTGPIDMRSDRNFDCTDLNYTLLDDISKAPQTGCFSTTAFGLLDSDHNVAIFNDSSEGEPISNGSNLALGAIPYSAGVASFSGFPANGTYMHLYKYFPNALRDARTITLQRYKQIISTPDMTLTDSTGQPIPVNPSALAYSSRGQWLVTESPNHSLLRINLATFSVLPFAPALEIPGQPYATHQAQLTISDDGRYAAVASSEFSTFTVYDLSSCSGGSANDDLASQTCASYNYWPYVRSQVTGGLSGISHIRFLNDSLLSFDAGDAAGASSYELSPSGPITSLIGYLGLGDSYASGQGAGDYLSDTDTTTSSCHISDHSYPLLLNADEFDNAGHSVACSGATISDIDNDSPDYSGQNTDQQTVASREADGSDISIVHDFTPGYLPQQTFAEDYQPNVITVEAGGNDVGFRDMLLTCVSPLSSVKPLVANPNNCYSSYEDRLEVEQTIDRAYRKWVTLYRQLQQAAPNAKVYALGYPQIVASNGSCALNVRMTSSDISFTQDVTNYINSIVAKAATTAGVHYIDISHALYGHRLCEAGSASVAMNGLTAGNDIYDSLSKDSYHPNALGQELLEQAILQATHNFAAIESTPIADPASPAPEPTNSDPLLNAPKSGRQVHTVIPDDSITGNSVVRGNSLTFLIDGLKDGLLPNTTYAIQIGGNTIGSLASDSAGTISGNLPIPATTPGGDQPVIVSGQNADGDPVIITKVIYVDSSGDDSDGDGVPNEKDSCPTVANSGVDADHDGVDDACDPVISSGGTNSGPDPSSGAQSNTTSTTTGTTNTNVSGSSNVSAGAPPVSAGSSSNANNTNLITQNEPSSPTESLSGNHDNSANDDMAALTNPILLNGADYDTTVVNLPITGLSNTSFTKPATIIQGSSSPQSASGIVGPHTDIEQPLITKNDSNRVNSFLNYFPALKIIHWLRWTILVVGSALGLLITNWELNRREKRITA